MLCGSERVCISILVWVSVSVYCLGVVFGGKVLWCSWWFSYVCKVVFIVFFSVVGRNCDSV